MRLPELLTAFIHFFSFSSSSSWRALHNFVGYNRIFFVFVLGVKPQVLLSLQFLLWNEKRRDWRGERLSSQQRMYRISRLFGIFTRSQITMVTEDTSPALQTSVDLSSTPLFPSPSPTKTVTEELQKDQTPQVPPRIRPPQTLENAQQSPQPDTHPTLPLKRVSQPPLESSK